MRDAADFFTEIGQCMATCRGVSLLFLPSCCVDQSRPTPQHPFRKSEPQNTWEWQEVTVVGCHQRAWKRWFMVLQKETILRVLQASGSTKVLVTVERNLRQLDMIAVVIREERLNSILTKRLSFDTDETKATNTKTPERGGSHYSGTSLCYLELRFRKLQLKARTLSTL